MSFEMLKYGIPFEDNSDCQKLLSPAGHFELPAGHLIEFNRRPLPDIS